MVKITMAAVAISTGNCSLHVLVVAVAIVKRGIQVLAPINACRTVKIATAVYEKCAHLLALAIGLGKQANFTLGVKVNFVGFVNTAADVKTTRTKALVEMAILTFLPVVVAKPNTWNSNPHSRTIVACGFLATYKSGLHSDKK